jgi:hypothetical protein
MTALAVDRQRRWNAAPRGRRCLVLSFKWPNLQLADLVEFNRFKSRVLRRQRFTRYRVPGPKLVFSVRRLPYSDQKISRFTADAATALFRAYPR